MQYNILVTKNPNNGFSARPLVWPELVRSGNSEAEALAQVQKALAEFLAQSYIVQVEVAAPSSMDDPWLHYAGFWKDMPSAEWEQYLTAIDQFRHDIDLQTTDTTSSDLA